MSRRRFLVALATFGLVLQAAYVDPGVSRAAIADGPNGIWFVATAGAGTNGNGSSCSVPDYTTGDFATGAEGAIEAAIGAASSGDTITLCAGTYDLTSGTVDVATSGLTFLGDTTPGATVVTTSGSRRLFDASGAAGADPITFTHVTMTGGSADEFGGGAIRAAGSIVVEDSRFLGNGAPTGDGGAIIGSTVSVARSEFSGNTALGTGGAIAAQDVSVAGSDFTSNSANLGGAIGWAGEAGTRIEVTSSTFTTNGAGWRGGAIFAGTTGDILVRLEAVTARGNGAVDGGVVAAASSSSLYESRIVVLGGSFRDNSAVSGGAIFGGADSGDGTTGSTVHGATFLRNYAGTSGGAIAVNAPVQIGASTFLDNTAGSGGTGQGGAVYAEGAIEITSSTFARNRAGAGGGAVDGGEYLAVPAIAAVNSTFVDNTSGGSGGAIRANSGFGRRPVAFVNVTFRDNTAGEGGHLYVGDVDTTDTILVGGTCALEPGSSVTEAGVNLAEDASCLNGSLPIDPADLHLGALAYDGYDTPTIPLEEGSIAIDAIAPAACSTTEDQRGVSRPIGFGCDVGAVEATGPTQVVLDFLTNPSVYGAVARFRATVISGAGDVTGGTISLTDGDRVIGTCEVTSNSCDFSTGQIVRDFLVGRHRLTATYSGAPELKLWASSTSGDQYVLKGSAQLLYTGQTYFVPAPADFPLQATLTENPGIACGVSGKTVAFYSSTDGVSYDRLLARATTSADGVAATTTTGDFTTGVTFDGTAGQGIYEIMARLEDAGCEALNTATFLVDATGGSSSGSGQYVVPGAGRVRFAYKLSADAYRYRGNDITTLTGTLSWHANGKFKLRGTITGYTRLTSCPAPVPGTATCAAITGTGTLSMWVRIGPGDVYGWQPIGNLTGYQVTIADGGAPTVSGNGKGGGSRSNKPGRDYTDWFRMNIPSLVVTGESATLQDLKGGNIVVR